MVNVLLTIPVIKSNTNDTTDVPGKYTVDETKREEGRNTNLGARSCCHMISQYCQEHTIDQGDTQTQINLCHSEGMSSSVQNKI